MRVPDKKRKDEVEQILYPPGISWLVPPTFDEDGVQRSAGLSRDGEHGDPVPTQPPIGMTVSQGDELHTALRTMFIKEREAFKAAIEREQFETEDEANDFLVEEDLFPPGNEPWEDVFEFPAGDEGRSPTLAGEAPNGSGTPQNAPSQPSTSTASAGSVFGSSEVKTEQMQKSAVGDIGKDVGDPGRAIPR